ncbi:hypothetical protein MHYP_G00055080 [Metynnis hypsauchen]
MYERNDIRGCNLPICNLPIYIHPVNTMIAGFNSGKSFSSYQMDEQTMSSDCAGRLIRTGYGAAEMGPFSKHFFCQRRPQKQGE